MIKFSKLIPFTLFALSFLIQSCTFLLPIKDEVSICGNGVIEKGEDCEIANLGGFSCESLGYEGGELKCNESCHFNTSECTGNLSVCGNGVIENAEECDGTNLNNYTCEALGYIRGNLSCDETCHFNTNTCVGSGHLCGNGVIEGTEECDTDNLNGFSCESLGYGGGELYCDESCHYDTGNCTGEGSVCGNGIVESGEECDGTAFLGPCMMFGDDYQWDYPSSCLSDCTVDISTCKIKWNFVTSGSYASCGIKVDGTMYCWGKNDYGQLGLDDTINRRSPEQVGTDTDWIFASFSTNYACGIRENSQLYCWGDNFSGKLGLGDTTERHVPEQVGTDADWTIVFTGSNHTCGIKVDGSLYCWGYNSWGELGLGDTTERHSPARVGTDTWSIISLGYGYTCGIKNDEGLYCWGGNGHGQLGLGDTVERHSPERVGTDTDWIFVSVGYYHTCGLKEDNSLYCWGSNDYGQLGMGDTVERHAPVQVDTDTDWIMVSAGYSHTCGLQDDGSLYCWGDNDYGQLGMGDTVERHSPERVEF